MKNYVHNTRDEAIKRLLERLGVKAINTECPVMWCLTAEHSEKISIDKVGSYIHFDR